MFSNIKCYLRRHFTGKINCNLLQMKLNQLLVKSVSVSLGLPNYIKSFCLVLYINPHFSSPHCMYFGIPVQTHCIAVENSNLCVSFCLWPIGRKGTELQQRRHPLPLFAHLHYGYHHAMLPPQCLLQPGQPGSCLLWYRVLHPLPTAHLLLRLARQHHQGH